MPTDPRLLYGWDEQDAHTQSIGADGTINVPLMSTSGYSTSTALGLAVTNVATGLGAPLCGLGSATNRLLGKVKYVDPDGTVTVQDEGYMTLAYVTGGSQPVPNNAVDVDGTGKVQNSATYRGARCEGFMTDPQSGVLVCIVKI